MAILLHCTYRHTSHLERGARLIIDYRSTVNRHAVCSSYSTQTIILPVHPWHVDRVATKGVYKCRLSRESRVYVGPSGFAMWTQMCLAALYVLTVNCDEAEI